MIDKRIDRILADLEHQLYVLGVSEGDRDFIMKSIKSCNTDENMLKTPNGFDAILNNRDPSLVELFHKASEDAGIVWVHEMPGDEL